MAAAASKAPAAPAAAAGPCPGAPIGEDAEFVILYRMCLHCGPSCLPLSGLLVFVPA